MPLAGGIDERGDVATHVVTRPQEVGEHGDVIRTVACCRIDGGRKVGLGHLEERRTHGLTGSVRHRGCQISVRLDGGLGA